MKLQMMETRVLVLEEGGTFAWNHWPHRSDADEVISPWKQDV